MFDAGIFRGLFHIGFIIGSVLLFYYCLLGVMTFWGDFPTLVQYFQMTVWLWGGLVAGGIGFICLICIKPFV